MIVPPIAYSRRDTAVAELKISLPIIRQFTRLRVWMEEYLFNESCYPSRRSGHPH